jgi:hypothetical protein
MVLELAGLLTDERPLRTVWQLAPRGRPERRSVLIASASCLPWRFSGAIRRHIAGARKLLVGGPLDTASIERALQAGACPPAASLYGALGEAERGRLHRLLGVPLLPREAHELYRALLFGAPHEWLDRELRTLKPWRAFLGLWTRFCSEKGGAYNLDLDAVRAAATCEKPVLPLQSVDEQIAFLESIPVPRIAGFIAHADWERHRSRYARAYVAGDYAALLACGREFPMHDEALVAARAAVLAPRMAADLHAGGVCAVIGASHCAALIERLREAGIEACFSGLRRAPARAASA